MATLALGLVGTAVGASIGGGITLLGTTLTAASIGGMIGSTIGGYVDSLIIASLTPAIRNEGPRLQEITVMQSTEGAVVNKLYGTMRVGGNLIWSTRFNETRSTTSEDVGGKGGGGSRRVETTTYTYSVSMAVAFCEGSSRTQLGRVWMDGKEVDLSIINFTFYQGTETQMPDSVIQSVEGAENTPAFRGTCYIVFEDFELENYGNRIPQITAEIISPIATDDPDDISNVARSFCLAPGYGEFAYGTDIYTLQNASGNVTDSLFPNGGFFNNLGTSLTLPGRSDDSVTAQYLNMHTQYGESDFVRSMTQLAQYQPNLGAVLLTVGWFGDDLRVDQCEIKPYAEYSDVSGVITPREWNVAGYVRSDADIPAVGQDDDGNLIYEGTPSDDVVVEAIQWLKAQGYRVVFYPLINMHIGEDNALPDPYQDDPDLAAIAEAQLTVLSNSTGTVIPQTLDTYLFDPDSFDASNLANIDLYEPYGDTYNNSNAAIAVLYLRLDISDVPTGYTIYIDTTYVVDAIGAFRTTFNESVSIQGQTAAEYAAGTGGATLAGVNNSPLPPEGVTDYANNFQVTKDASHDYLLIKMTMNGASKIGGSHRYVSARRHTVVASSNSGYADAAEALTAEQSTQLAFPGRDRITCMPAAGYAGTVDQTSAAATQVNTFFTRTWGFNNMIEHYAQLCADAGGVDAFLIGSGMSGVTSIRSSADTYPAVAHLQTLAATVSGIMGAGTEVSYAADWSEYHSHRPSDGSGDVYFNLDPLWADANVDFIGINNYFPVSDWRDGSSHLDYDADAGLISPHNPEYLQSNIEGGEYYDWYYASSADRDTQTRTSISDASYGKPWVFRQKDIRNWWNNSHYNRPGGTEDASPTAYAAGSKPIWFTEFGCPCVDKGTNQPDTLLDAKSSESALPYYSNGLQDEYLSRIYAEATLTYWRDNSPSGMLDIDNMFLWCWDVRPFPDYPNRTDAWSDSDLWQYGPWMTGRLAYPALPRLIETLCEEVGVTDYDTTLLNGAQSLLRGYLVNNISATRDVIASLMTGFQFDAFESEGKIKFALKASTSLTALYIDDFVSTSNDPSGFTIARTQDSELPKRVLVDYINADSDYEVSSLDAKRHQTDNVETSSVRLPMSLASDYVKGLADSILHQAWVARESGSVNLPPSLFKLDPGDGITFPLGSQTGQARIQSIENGEFREVSFQAFDLSLYTLPVYPAQPGVSTLTQVPGFPELYPLDIPLYSGDEPSHWSPRLAVYASPWPGSVAVYRDEDPDVGSQDWVLGRSLNIDNTLGVLVETVENSKTGVWLRNQTITVNLLGGTLPSADSDLRVLNGDNVCAMQNDQGHWEIFQYKTATLDGNGHYVLSDLIRGQLGTEWVMTEDAISAGNAFVLLENQFSIDPSTAPYLPLTAGDRDVQHDLRFGNAYQPVENDDAYLESSFTHEAMAKKPYAPTQLKAVWDLDSGSETRGDIALSWIRRTRFDGDPWEVAAVPLNEETEGYELEFLDGSTVVREVTDLSEPSYTYTEAMQVADFGSAQTTSITVRVYQMSAEVGRGIAAEETLVR